MAYGADFTDPIDVVRYKIQDTDPDEPIFVDAEIGYELGVAGGNLVTVTGNEPAAALALAVTLMHRYAKLADTTDGELSVKASQLYDHAKDLVAFLATEAAGGAIPLAAPYAGGISRADIDAREANTDRAPNAFAHHNGPWRAPAAWWGR